MRGVEPAATWESVAGDSVAWFAPVSPMKVIVMAMAMSTPSAVVSVPSPIRNRGARGMLCGVDMVCSVLVVGRRVARGFDGSRAR